MLSRHRRSPKNLTINDVYPEWINTHGVISSITEAPWVDSVDPIDLDLAYHGVRSGEKFAAPLLYNFLDTEGTITTSGYSTIGRILWTRYHLKWGHLWQLYNTEYNPLDSYNIRETRTRDSSRTDDVEDSRTVNLSDVTTYPQKSTSSSQLRTPNLSETKTFPEKSVSTSQTRTPNLSETTTMPSKTTTISQTRTPNLEEETVVDDAVTTNVESSDDTTYGKVLTTEAENESTAQDNTFGFNTTAADGVPAGKSTQSGSNSTTETASGTDSRDKTEDTTSTRDTTTTVTSTGTETVAGTETESYTGNKSVSSTGTERVTEDVAETYEGSETVNKTGTETTSNTVTESYTGTESINHTGTDVNAREATGSESEEIESTKTGNIFKSPAELLSADREFWLTEFFSIVFDDIDAMLTLSIYSESEVYHKVF